MSAILRCAVLALSFSGSAVTSAFGAGVPPTILQAEQERIAVIEKVSPAVIAVMGKSARGGGSGVIVTPDGYALTNYHVTSAIGDEMSCGMPDGKRYDAVIVGVDPTGDVAVIKLRGLESFPCVEMGDSDKLRVGEWTLAMGNPFMLATDFKPTVTFGIVSGLHRYQYPTGKGLLEYPDCIQVDTAVNPGNSGGPLFNLKGELVGINGRVSFERRVRVNSGFAYAISINQIRNFLPALKGGRIVDHATLGATVSSDEHGRPVVREILSDLDAYRRGLRIDDEVVSLAGRKITSVNEFKNILGILPPNWRVPLIAHRGANRLEMMVRLSGQHGVGWDFEAEAKRKRRPPIRIKPGEKVPLPKKPETKAKKAPLVEKRPGFSNFVFNRQEQDRVLGAFSAFFRKSDTPLPAGTWGIRGHVGRSRFSARIGDEAAHMKYGDMDFVVGKEDLFAPPTDDGVAVIRSLMLWRALLLKGKDAFKDIYYDGQVTTPLGMCDLVVTKTGPITVGWHFLPDSGSLQLFEVSFDRYTDPYEFILGRNEEYAGALLPGVFLSRVGDDLVGKFSITRFDFSAAEEKSD